MNIWYCDNFCQYVGNAAKATVPVGSPTAITIGQHSILGRLLTSKLYSTWNKVTMSNDQHMPMTTNN